MIYFAITLIILLLANIWINYILYSKLNKVIDLLEGLERGQKVLAKQNGIPI